MKTYNTLYDAYQDLNKYLINCAKRILNNKEDAEDCCQIAFEKCLIYLKKNKKRKISGFLLMREVTKQAIKLNQEMDNEVRINFDELESGDSIECEDYE